MNSFEQLQHQHESSEWGIGTFLVMANPMMTFYIANFKLIGVWISTAFQSAIEENFRDQLSPEELEKIEKEIDPTK